MALSNFDMTGAVPVGSPEGTGVTFDMAGARWVGGLQSVDEVGIPQDVPFTFDEPEGAVVGSLDYVANIVNELEASEGTKPHVGIDSENLTLPYGIVADSVEYDGNTITPGRWSGQLDADKVNMETATKWGIRRGDYESDYAWTSALVSHRADKVREMVPDIADDTALEALVTATWNTGFGGLKWSGFKETIAQMQEAPEDRDAAQTIGWAKHSYAGGKPVFGLFKRRIIDANLALPEDERITEVKQEKAVKEGGRWTTKFVAMRGGEVVREFQLKGRPSTNRERTIKLGE